MANILDLRRRFAEAKERRARWERLWDECRAYAAPMRRSGDIAGASARVPLYDTTAATAVEKLAASLVAELTPPWMRWFGLRPGDEVADEAELTNALDTASGRIVGHFDRSNFAVEIHQCFVDLVTVGAAVLTFEEAPIGAPSAFSFRAAPMDAIWLEEDGAGRIAATFRLRRLPVREIARRFKALLGEAADEDPDRVFPVVEAVLPGEKGFGHFVFIDDEAEAAEPLLLGWFAQSPFVTFRWLKAPDEAYGRSPVMVALPDIRTANKVVELVLKNASIAVTGIWLADDDGVLNPANIRLAPGAIIPKAAGSAGLTPLAAPGRFDVSELVLDDMRSRIRDALLVDRLHPSDQRQMTATEILARSSETARLLAAIYGRLQNELLGPLVRRAAAILARRGEIAEFALDGREVELYYTAPLARLQAREEARNVLNWLDHVGKIGAVDSVDPHAAARWLADAFDVPKELLRAPPSPSGNAPALDQENA